MFGFSDRNVRASKSFADIKLVHFKAFMSEFFDATLNVISDEEDKNKR